MDLSVKIGDLTLKNPVITASGTFGFGLEFKRYGDLARLGGISVKGMSLKPRQGNPMPRIAETPCGMLNAIGIQNPGVEVFIEKYLPLLPADETAIIANLYASSVEEFAQLAGVLAAQDKVAALEVNVSCPNVKEGGAAFGQNPAMIARVAEAVRKKSGDKTVIVKLSPNVTSVARCAEAAETGGAHAISLINTVTGMAVDLERRTPRLANVVGGLSGPAIKPVGLRCVFEAVRAVDIPVIGLGGIASARDALEYILVGAHAIQVGTASFMRPDTAFQIVEDLPKVMEELNIPSLEDLRGSLKLK